MTVETFRKVAFSSIVVVAAFLIVGAELSGIIDSVLVLYAIGIGTCIWGAVLFVWLIMGHGRKSYLLICIMLMFVFGIWSMSLSFIARLIYDYWGNAAYQTFVQSFIWKWRTIPRLLIFLSIIVYVHGLLRYGKNREIF